MTRGRWTREVDPGEKTRILQVGVLGGSGDEESIPSRGRAARGPCESFHKVQLFFSLFLLYVL